MARREIANARRLRRLQTDAERQLWVHLRDRRLAGWKFRRQVSLDIYVADFLCKEARLVVEIDGSQHSDRRAEHDRLRTARLSEIGYRTVRFWNNDISGNLDGVLAAILAACQEGPHPGPLPQAGERELPERRAETPDDEDF